MQKIGLAALAALALPCLGGCATVINGTSQDFKFQSDPGGATVSTTAGVHCVTPCAMELKRRTDFRADVSRDGYKPVYVLVQSRTGGAAAGNILLGGLIGGVVDGANGATNHLYPNPLSLRMVPVGGSGEAVLLDKNGKEISTVIAHNDKVRKDVGETIGVAAAGQVGTAGPPEAVVTTAAVAAVPEVVAPAEPVAATPAAAPATDPAPAPAATPATGT